MSYQEVLLLLILGSLIWLMHAEGEIAKRIQIIDFDNRTQVAELRQISSELYELKAENPHARLLGKTVEYRKFETSDWQRGVVWCVGINGGLCIRDAEYLEQPGKWIHSHEAVRRVREVES